MTVKNNIVPNVHLSNKWHFTPADNINIRLDLLHVLINVCNIRSGNLDDKCNKYMYVRNFYKVFSMMKKVASKIPSLFYKAFYRFRSIFLAYLSDQQDDGLYHRTIKRQLTESLYLPLLTPKDFWKDCLSHSRQHQTPMSKNPKRCMVFSVKVFNLDWSFS